LHHLDKPFTCKIHLNPCLDKTKISQVIVHAQIKVIHLPVFEEDLFYTQYHSYIRNSCWFRYIKRFLNDMQGIIYQFSWFINTCACH
jgi:hypothetical protein